MADPVTARAGDRFARAKPRYKLALAVQYAAAHDRLPTRSQLRTWVNAALQRDADVTVRLVDADEARTLNRQYRGQNHATNVLSFIYSETDPLSGDIALCVPVVQREAREQHKNLQAHYAHLVVHGMLHLQGYDHDKAATARNMEALETEIVTGLGYADPYKSKDEG
ncbi:MAG: rRNA maturation RNase YbeY [Betaproteobacteria bacterium]